MGVEGRVTEARGSTEGEYWNSESRVPSSVGVIGSRIPAV